jgi:hypothetical protein
MESFQGFITTIYTNAVTARGKQTNTYNIKVSGETFKCNFKSPGEWGCSENDEVLIEYEINQYGNNVKKMSKVVGAIAGAAANMVPTTTNGGGPSAVPSNTASPRKRAFPVELTDPEISQIRRSAAHLAGKLMMPWLQKAADNGIGFDPLAIEGVLKTARELEDYFTGHDEPENDAVSTSFDKLTELNKNG